PSFSAPPPSLPSVKLGSSIDSKRASSDSIEHAPHAEPKSDPAHMDVDSVSETKEGEKEKEKGKEKGKDKEKEKEEREVMKPPPPPPPPVKCPICNDRDAPMRCRFVSNLPS